MKNQIATSFANGRINNAVSHRVTKTNLHRWNLRCIKSDVHASLAWGIGASPEGIIIVIESRVPRELWMCVCVTVAIHPPRRCSRMRSGESGWECEAIWVGWCPQDCRGVKVPFENQQTHAAPTLCYPLGSSEFFWNTERIWTSAKGQFFTSYSGFR